MAISTTSAKFVKSGETLDYTPTAAVSAGDIKAVDGCVCIALWDIDANQASTLKIVHKGEVISVTTDEAIGATDAGTAIYVTSAGLVTKTSEGNTLVGYARDAIAATDLTFAIVGA